MAVFIIVFACAAALFFGLRYWGKRQQQSIASTETEEGDGSLADNLEFAADMATRMARRARRDADGPGDSGDGGGGDGG